VLIARSGDKLAAARDEIKETYTTVQVEIFEIDFSNFDEESREALMEFLSSNNIEPGILINNVGVSYEFPMFFHELSDQQTHNLMAVNVESTLWMTRLLLPGMLDRKTGAIVNISSLAGLISSPLLTEYSASKSFVEVPFLVVSSYFKIFDILVFYKGVGFRVCRTRGGHYMSNTHVCHN